MPTKSKKRPRKKATPKPIVIKLTQKHKKQARESIRKHGVAKFKIHDIAGAPRVFATRTVHWVYGPYHASLVWMGTKDRPVTLKCLIEHANGWVNSARWGDCWPQSVRRFAIPGCAQSGGHHPIERKTFWFEGATWIALNPLFQPISQRNLSGPWRSCSCKTFC